MHKIMYTNIDFVGCINIMIRNNKSWKIVKENIKIVFFKSYHTISYCEKNTDKGKA